MMNATKWQPVAHKGQMYRGLVAFEDRQLCTRRYRSRHGVLPPGAEVVMPMMHGMGPMTSHAGSMLATLNVVTGSKRKPGRSQSLQALRQLPHFCPIGGEAIDLPGSFGAEIDPGVRRLEGIADWTARWIESISLGGSLVIPIARSASTQIVFAVADRNPGLIDAVVLLSPMLPSDRRHSNSDLLRRIEEGQCELNLRAFEWMNALCEQSSWQADARPLAQQPVLILTGEQDTQVSDRVREHCAGWADQFDSVRYFNVAGAGHDVLNLRNRGPALTAFAHLYQFVHDVRTGTLATQQRSRPR